MMDYPRISIVTPSFNQDEFLEDAIKSVVLQQYQNLEYILIDGGSSDNSVNIIKKYAHKISYWVSEHDGGHGAGLNKGFKQATGDVMGWINSDDMLTEWSLKTIAEIFTKFPHVNWIQGTNSWWNRRGQMTNSAQIRKNIYDYLTGNYAWIQQESVFWRRSLWEMAGGTISTRFKYMVDGELWSRFFLLDDLYTVDCILSGYRVYGDNRANIHYQSCLKEMEIIIEEMRVKCDQKVLNNAKKLKAILRGAQLAPIRRTIGTSTAQKIVGKTIGKRLFSEAGYKVIRWDVAMNDWVENSLPFR